MHLSPRSRAGGGEVARELQWLSARGRKGRRSPRLPRLVAFLAGMSVKP